MSRSPLLSEYNRQRSDYACPLCGGHTYEGEPCGSCFLPFKVMESIRSRPHPPRFVVVLGPTGVGKTVYLGMLLDLLSRGVGGLRGLSRSPYSLTLHRNLILALERQRFPEKTPVETDRWNWLHCEILGPRGKGAADIVTPDVAGEAVMSEMENPGTNKTIRALISRCAGMVVLVDLVEVVADGQSQELFAMQLISYLDCAASGKEKVAQAGGASGRCLHQGRSLRGMDQRSRVVRAGQRLESSCPVSSKARTLLLLLLRRGRLVREARGRLGAREPGPPAGRTARDCRAVCVDGQQAWLERFSDALHVPRLSPPLLPFAERFRLIGAMDGGKTDLPPIGKNWHSPRCFLVRESGRRSLGC